MTDGLPNGPLCAAAAVWHALGRACLRGSLKLLSDPLLIRDDWTVDSDADRWSGHAFLHLRDLGLELLASTGSHDLASYYGRVGAAKPCAVSVCWPATERMNKANLRAEVEASFITVKP